MYSQLREDVAQLHARRHRGGAAAGEELVVEVRRRQAEVVEVEHARPRPRASGPSGSMRATRWPRFGPHLDQARDGGLARIRAAAPVEPRRRTVPRHGRRSPRAPGHARAPGAAGAPRESKYVRHCAAHARRLAQVLLVERVEIIGVTAVEGCRFEHAEEKSAGRPSV